MLDNIKVLAYQKRIVLCLASACLLTNSTLQCQTFTDSNLPIIIINTDNSVTIPDAPKIGATMKIINHTDGSRNYLTDQNDATALNYNGRIGIEIRGSSTQSLEKKQYGLETRLSDGSNNNVSLLGMPKDNDWILNGLGFDPSLIRDYISYNLSRVIGEYATRTRYCEVVINGNYRGLYILQEKIKRDKNRVDVTELKKTISTLPDLSGGYITKSDKVAGKDIPSWSMPSYTGGSVDFIHSEPSPANITSAQNNYIKSIFFQLANFSNTADHSIQGYPSVIDLPSFIDFMLINELAANVDAYQFSTYFHKDRNGKLRAGPIWDFNLTYGNDLTFWGLDRSWTNTWQFDNGDNLGAKFWLDLFNDATFKCYLAKRWLELTQDGQPLSLTSIETLIDTTVVKISEASAREKARWSTEWANYWSSPIDFAAEVSSIKGFLAARISWINQNIGSAANCSNVSTPPLVITKINYNPQTSAQFPDSNDQEFIEIVNNGDSEVDVSGIYFQGTGLAYQFPMTTKIPAYGVIQLASKFGTFFQRYGHSPFDDYTRYLANEGQKIILSDAFGNIIDEVDYSATAPWPNANGNGKYLSLIDVNLDNNIASNWTATDASIELSVLTAVERKKNLAVFPNPTESSVTINAEETIEAVQVSDIQGKIFREIILSGNSTSVDMREVSAGIYVFTIQSASGIQHVKVLKK